MSKIGKQPIIIPQNVTIGVIGSQVKVTGPKGELVFAFHKEVRVEIIENKVIVSRNQDTKFAKSLHGLTRSIIANMVKGVTEGHQKILEIVGVGYRAQKQGDDLILIIVSGLDKAAVGETAAKIRRVRPPEPYKGKGINFFGEVIRRKAGKTVKAVGGGP